MNPVTVTAVATVVTAIAAVIYTAITAYMARATAENTKALTQASETASRPYVDLTKVQFDLVHNGLSELYATVKNGGSVPARRVEIGFHIVVNGTTFLREASLVLATTLLPNQSTSFLCYSFEGEESRFVNPPASITVSFDIGYQGMTERRYRAKASATYENPLKPFSSINAVGTLNQ